MTILYPVNEPLMLKRARDARIIRMAHALSVKGHKVYLVVGKTAKTLSEILDYYDVSLSENLAIIQVPILKGQGRIRITINAIFLWSAFRKAARIARVEPIQVFYFSVLEVADYFLKRKDFFPGAKWIYEMHELARYPENFNPSPRGIKEEALEKRVLTGLDGIFTTTEALRRVVADRFPRLLSATIPLGMNSVSSNAPLNSPTGEKFKVCYIGQLYDAQGVDVLIKAMTSVPFAEAHILGGTSEQIGKLKGLAQEQGVSDRIVFYGFVEPAGIPRIIESMDVFVVPSKDTIRMNYVAHIKIYEFMAARRPIVASDLLSIREILTDEGNALLVRPADPSALASGIRRIREVPGLARRLAEKAYGEVSAYSWGKRAERLTEFIRSVPEKN